MTSDTALVIVIVVVGLLAVILDGRLEDTSMTRHAATEEDVKAFIAAVFPDAPSLAMVAYDEQHVLRTATALIQDLRHTIATEIKRASPTAQTVPQGAQSAPQSLGS